MHSYLQFVATPTADTPGTTLVLHFDNKRYLIGNIAEGTQRASVQQRVRLLKVSEIFLTGTTTWENTGGLIGMILTLADSASASVQSGVKDIEKKITAKARREGVSMSDGQIAKQAANEVKEKTRLSIFGGRNLNYTLATARRFVFRKGMPVDVHEFGCNTASSPERAPDWTDENIRVWALSIRPSQKSPRKRSHDEINEYESSLARTVLDPRDQEKVLMMAKSVVSEMFDSTWRMDALVETPINQVQLPAALFVRDPETHKIVKYTGPLPGGGQPVPDVTVLVRRPWPGALVESLPPTEPAKEAISYIISNHRQRGKFKPQRATELGVEKGHKWARLSSGQSVENNKGETITPEMVLEESKDGGGVVVIDLPSSEYVESLVTRPEWKSDQIMAGVGAFVWMLAPGVAANQLLKQFMGEMKHMKHIIASPDLCSNRLALDSVAAATTRLEQVDPARYTVPVHSNSPLSSSAGYLEGIKDLAVVADRGQKVQLEPFVEFQTNETTPLLDVDQVKKDMSQDVLDLAAKAHQNVQADEAALASWANSLPQKDAEIVTLGTGSALPSKYRNVSATLLQVPGWGSMLFDCGENTLGQLKRVFSPGEFEKVMQELRMIWISHMHADHHLGTVSVIREWYKTVHGSKPAPISTPAEDVDFDASSLLQQQNRLSVVSETAMLHWLEEYSNVDDYGFSRIAPLGISAAVPSKGVTSNLSWFIPPSMTQTANYSLAREPWRNKLARAKVSPSVLNLQDIQAVQVQHCHGARAVSITFPSGFKASYSGDCRPSKPFTQIGKGSTVCIHEATFDDELQGDAEAKNHTTTSEALSVALGMEAKACVLTHFSQRYQKVPVLEYSDEDDAIASLDIADNDGDVSANPDDDLGAPVADIAAATSAALPKIQDSTASANKAAKHVKIKAGSNMKVCVAFDYMRVKVAEIAQMEKYTDALIRLFAEEELEEEKQAQQPDSAQPASKKKGKGGKGQRNN